MRNGPTGYGVVTTSAAILVVGDVRTLSGSRFHQCVPERQLTN